MDILIPQFQQTNYYFLDTIKHIVNAVWANDCDKGSNSVCFYEEKTQKS